MIGTTVSFKDEYGYIRSGEVMTIDSDKFDDIKWDEVPKYWSKKTKSYRPVKEKDMETVFIVVVVLMINIFLYAISKQMVVKYTFMRMVGVLQKLVR